LDIFNGGDSVTPGSGETSPATVEKPLINGDPPPKPDMSGVFGGITDFFNQITANPVLLLIIMVVIIVIIGKLF